MQNVEVASFDKPKDEEHEPEKMDNLCYAFCGITSILKCEVLDEYGNVIRQLKNDSYDIVVNYHENNILDVVGLEMKNGKMFVSFLPNQIGEKQISFQIVDKRLSSTKKLIQVSINVLHPPCSPCLTLMHLNDNHLEQCCTAGEDYVFKSHFYDIFDNLLHPDSTSTYSVNVQLSLQNEQVSNEQVSNENVSIRKFNTSRSVEFVATLCLKKAGSTNVRVIVHSGSKSRHKNISFKVLPSTPHSLGIVEFSTTGAINEYFDPPPLTMYKNQWSILEATLFDSYDNAVCELNRNYNISLKMPNEEREKIEYRDADFVNETLGLKLKINETGVYNLSVTLTDTNSPDEVVCLEETPVYVLDAPLYLSGSKLHCPQSCIAGKKVQVKIFLLDVFGCPLPTDRMKYYGLTGKIICPDGSEEITEPIIAQDELSIVACFSVILTKAGSRELIIYYENYDSYQWKEWSIRVDPDFNDVHWELVAVEKTAFRREKLIATTCLFDRFHNEVPIFSNLSNIPKLVKLNGPDGLYVRREFVDNHDNLVEIHFDFFQTGKYNLCLSDRDGNQLEDTLFSITVSDAPLDYNRSSIKWLPQYDDVKDQPVFPEDESFRCCLNLKDVVGFDYDGEKKSSMSIQIKYNNTLMKNIVISSTSNKSGSYTIVVPLNNRVRDEARPKFWCFVYGKKIVNPLVLPTFEIFEKYEDDSMKIYRFETQSYKSLKILCKGVEPNEVIGKDHCHLNNLKRVCELDEDPKVDKSSSFGNHTTIEIPLHEVSGRVLDLRNVLLHLLRAMSYRKRAFELDKAREKWKRQASEAYENGMNEDRPHFYSVIKEKYAKLMKRYHDEACEEFFQFFNSGRGQSEVDLHGLLVVDENKLHEFRQQLLSKRSMSQADMERKIQQERDHGNEAIRYLWYIYSFKACFYDILTLFCSVLTNYCVL